MPIKTKGRGGLALSDIRRLPRLGHIRLGVKKVSQKTGREYPSEVDYFILDPKTPDERRNRELIEEFKKFYGEQPKSIRIMFPPADPEIFFPQYYKRYGSSTLLKCKGDGEEAVCSLEEFAEGLEILGKTEQGLIRVKCLGPECPHQNGEKPSCNRMASLQVLLPELKGNGVWQINTSSWNSIVNMNSAIEWLNMCCRRYYGIPFNLMRVPTDIQHEGKKTVHYILTYDQNESLLNIQRSALIPMERTALPAPDETKDDLFYPAHEEAREEKVPSKVTLGDLKKSANQCKTVDKLISWYRSIENGAEQQLTDKEFRELVNECATIRVNLQAKGAPKVLQLLTFLREATTEKELDYRWKEIQGKAFESLSQKELEQLEMGRVDIRAGFKTEKIKG